MLLEYTYIDSVSETERIVQVELNSTPFTKYWVEYVLRLAEKVPKVQWYSALLNSTISISEPHQNLPHLCDLLITFVYFKLIDIDEEFSEVIDELMGLIKAPDTVTQQHLNKWHRIFTKMEYKYCKLETPISDSVDYQKFWKSIQDINTFTHRLETFTYPMEERRNSFMGLCQYSIQFTNANNLNYIGNRVFDPENIEMIPEYFHFDFATENYDYDVWLHEDITGKDQIKAWLDRDDLTEFDVTGNLLITPGIILDPHNIYRNVIDDESFKSDSRKTGKTLDRYPLGRIKNKDDIEWETFINCKVTKIKLNDKILWETLC